MQQIINTAIIYIEKKTEQLEKQLKLNNQSKKKQDENVLECSFTQKEWYLIKFISRNFIISSFPSETLCIALPQ